MISCGGCGTISMGVQRRWLSDGSLTQFYYPSPVSRKEPDWMLYMRVGLAAPKEEMIGDLMYEVYRAVDGKQYRLAAMGIRALLEQVMIQMVGDHQTFDQKLDKFQKQGYVSEIQRDAMSATLEVGHAVMHRGHLPTERDLTVALDIVEGVLAPIYGHKIEADKLIDKVPPRAPRPKKS